MRAVLFDAGNTLVFLDYDRLAQEVGAALQLPLNGEGLRQHEDAAARAMEQAAATDQARAAAYLEALFLHGGVPPDRMGEVRECLIRMHRQLHLWCSVAKGAADSLKRLRDAGLRLGVVSNSDGRVEEALEAAGLRRYFDVVIDSARVGVEKPDPRIFHAALEALGVAPSEALYVGDLYEVDIAGANAAGIEAVLMTTSAHGSPPDCRTTPSIEALVTELLSANAVAPSQQVREN
ncbi:MAG TPA: HAD-IA family hydrolase [Gemmatimonadales bacterium]|nr:HAD-IA family hydrolase [Gemmatimonadales bacterium]